MRNVLVFPDKSEHDFMYPVNRDIHIGERLQVQFQDHTVHVLVVTDIKKTDKVIYYYLSFSAPPGH